MAGISVDPQRSPYSRGPKIITIFKLRDYHRSSVIVDFPLEQARTVE